MLASVVADTGCIVPAYCFMPDHQHLIVSGTRDDSDMRQTIVQYKQRTGFWMSRNTSGLGWQKNFYDHVIRRQEDLTAQVRYILDNPVRKGLVSSWQEYPFKGSVGCAWDDVIEGMM
jgi:putative transposase